MVREGKVGWREKGEGKRRRGEGGEGRGGEGGGRDGRQGRMAAHCVCKVLRANIALSTVFVLSAMCCVSTWNLACS